MAGEHFDLIVIGAGPAGEKGAAQAAYFGKRVAVIEKEAVSGGAAANTGTLPSKTLRETALFLSGFRNRQLQGLDLSWARHTTSVRDFMARERVVVGKERARIDRNLERHHVCRYRGTARLTGPHAVAVRPPEGAEVELTGDVILIATGSRPYRPPGFRFEDLRIYDSDEILDLFEIPTSMLVVGGGVIGCEYACMFSTLGVMVTIVEKRDRIVGFLDAELSASLRMQMEELGIRIRTDDEVDQIKDDRELIEVRLRSGAALGVRAILVSAGRNGNTESLGLDAVGIAAQKRGQIAVNDHYQTSVPHIYAVGDVIGFPGLASTAMEQARLAMVHAFDLPMKRQLSPILPFGIYTVPECSMAGETEESLREKGIPYVVGRASYAANARGIIIGDDHGFLKLLFHRDSLRLLGVHVIGEQAAELVHTGLTALLLGEGADLFIQTCYNYPTLTELYKYATYDALGRLNPMKPIPPRPEELAPAP